MHVIPTLSDRSADLSAVFLAEGGEGVEGEESAHIRQIPRSFQSLGMTFVYLWNSPLLYLLHFRLENRSSRFERFNAAEEIARLCKHRC